MKGIGTKAIKIGVMMVTAVLMLTGYRFGFASDPDDPNEVVQEEPIDTSVDTFEYDASLSGTKITLLNSKAEIQVALTKMAEEYEKKSGVHVEIMPVTDGDSPYTKIVSMYNSGTPPTMAILDTTDVIALAEEKAVDLTEAGMKRPVSVAKEDWSLGAHQLQYIYETYDGTSEGAQEVIEAIKEGILDLNSYDRMNQFLNMFDILREYNVARKDPLGADYDEMAIDLVDGKTAFWFNGNWAWPNLSEAGAENSDAYGFLPYFLNNDPEDFANREIQASPSKQIMIDGRVVSDQERTAAREFLNWIVFSEIGQQMIVKTCNLIPPFQNNPYEPADPLSRDIYNRVHEERAFNASAIVPNDHWAVLGASMQKYLAGRSSREELIQSIENYWEEQR